MAVADGRREEKKPTWYFLAVYLSRSGPYLILRPNIWPCPPSCFRPRVGLPLPDITRKWQERANDTGDRV